MAVKNLFLAILAANVANATISEAIIPLKQEDLNTDLTNATNVANAIQSLTDAISVTQNVYKTADAVVTSIESCLT